MDRVEIGLRIAKSFLPWTSHTRTPTSKSLNIRLHRQWTPYSCTAAVLQMVCDFYKITMSHREAIQLLDCNPDGASLEYVAMVLRECGLKARTLRRVGVRQALKRGEPVITNDANSFNHDHAIVLIGETAKGFWVADSLVAEIYWRSDELVFAVADEFIAVASGQNDI